MANVAVIIVEEVNGPISDPTCKSKGPDDFLTNYYFRLRVVFSRRIPCLAAAVSSVSEQMEPDDGNAVL